MSYESQVADAIASLTARLDQAGVEESAPIAHRFVTDMLRNGWRPGRALPAHEPPLRPDSSATDVTAHVQRCREALRTPVSEEPS